MERPSEEQMPRPSEERRAARVTTVTGRIVDEVDKSKSRIPRILTYVVLGAVVAFGIITRPEPGDAEAAAQAAAPAAPDPIDPVPFRAEISAFERMVFQPTEPSENMVARMASRLVVLSNVVRGDGTDPNRSTVWGTVYDYASWMHAQTNATIAAPADDMRSRWLEVRGTVFQSAEWFDSLPAPADAEEEADAPAEADAAASP